MTRSEGPAFVEAAALQRDGGTRPLLWAILLVAAPNLLFLATHMASALLGAFCVACASVSLALVAQDLRRRSAPVDKVLLAICLGVAFALCLLGGEAHVFFANNDWLIRDAVLGDLVAHAWPLGYDYLGDQTILRAPLGLYLAPALVGKVLGLHAAHAALLAQDSLLFGCLLYMVAASAAPRRRALWIVAVFVAYSGWDVVGQIALGKSVAFATHLPRWAGGLQFSSAITQLFWAPNHALSGWMFVAAYLAWRRAQLAATSLLVVFGLCMFWSPLSMIGALPFAAFAAIDDARRRRVTLLGLAALAAMAIALAPLALYLVADSARVAHGGQPLGPDFFVAYAMFLCVEIVPYLLIVTLLRPPGGALRARMEVSSSDLCLLVAILLAAPFFRIGGSDFVMRATIPALALLALRVAATAMPADGAPARGAMLATLIALAIGFVSPLYEIGRAVTSPAFAISDCNLMTAARFPPNDGPMFHYVARIDQLRSLRHVLAMPVEWLRPDGQRASCWPDDTGFRG